MKCVQEKNLLLVVMTYLLIFTTTGCDKKIDATKIEMYSDKLVGFEEQPGYMIATGRKGIYVLAGRYRRFGADTPAGILLTIQGPKIFSIKSFCDQNPDYAYERVMKEAERQQKKIVHG